MGARGSLPPAARAVDDQRASATRPDVEGRSLATAYEAHSRALCRRGASTYALLGVVVLLAAIPLDHVRLGLAPDRLLPVRMVGAAAMGVVFLLLRSGLGRRLPRALALLQPRVAGVLLQALAVRSGGPASPINITTSFALLGVALLIPWHALWTATVCALFVGSYGSLALLQRGTSGGPPSLDNLVVAVAFGSVA